MSVSTREVERRSTPSPVELRKSANSDRTIGGLAAVYGRRSQPLGGFVEVVERKAFSKTSGDGWPGVLCRFNHNDMAVLGSVAGGSLTLAETRDGLDYECDVADTTAGRDALVSIGRGDVRNSSFAFQVYDQEWSRGDDDYPLRHLLSVRLIDVAPTPNPAYPDASVGLRSLAAQFGADPDDVFALARDDELRKLFRRTDQPVMSGRQALLAVMAEHPNAKRPLGLSPAQAKAELTRMAMPQPQRTLTPAEAKAELAELWRPVYGTG